MTFKKVVAWVEALAVAAVAVFVIMLFANDGGGAASAGADIFSSTCARCHGADGEGGIGPALANLVAKKYPDIEDQIAIVAGGKGTMPGFAGDLSDKEIGQVVEYTRTDLGG